MELKFSDNSDLVFDNLGKLVFVTEDEKLAQKIYDRFKVTKGDLFYNIEYGVPVIRGKITEEYMETIISDTIFDLEEIDSFEIVDFRIDGKYAHVKVIFYKVISEEIDEEIEEVTNELELDLDIEVIGGADIGG